MEAIKSMLRPPYHFLLQWLSALLAGFPAKHMTVIGVTGTKGKSTVCEMLYTIFNAAGRKTALASTIRFITPEGEERNLHKMTTPGRGFIQRFLARAKRAGATHAIVELTSEGARQYRHRFLELDALVVTNIHPEHIESHGSFDNYVAAKREIVRELERSHKKDRVLVANADIKETSEFLDAPLPRVLPFSKSELGSAPHVPLPGDMSRMNALAALKVATALGVDEGVARHALETMPGIRGRLERVEEGQDFAVIVDYAHTPESLDALYRAYPGRKICVLGNTGGGRDKWKRPKMGRIADSACEVVILTDEDSYDEDPRAILNEMAAGMGRAPQIILDRREAIRTALSTAHSGDTVIISGKGTDPFIMGPSGSKTPWDDASVVREELTTVVAKP